MQTLYGFDVLYCFIDFLQNCYENYQALLLGFKDDIFKATKIFVLEFFNFCGR